LSIGNRIFGLVQLSGLSLVPKPPARMTAFKRLPQTVRVQAYIPTFLIKRFREKR
jgi:hypothetical protein